MQQVYRKDRLALLQHQGGNCGLCSLPLKVEDMDDHHVTPRSMGGSNRLDNRVLMHRWCHHAHHQRIGYKH